MFSAAFVALCLSAAVSAAPGLSLKVTGPESVDGLANFKVVTTLSNTGTETLKLLKDPRGALSSTPAHTFSIADQSGATPSFTGRRVKYVPSTVIANNRDESFVVLAPGQSVSIDHDLSQAYNFTRSGAGTYSIEASNLFHYVDPATKTAVPIYADNVAHHASVKGQLAVARPSRTLTKRITYNGCSSSRKTDISTAATAAQSYAAGAQSYLQSHTSSTTRYTTWFGTYTSARHDQVLSHYTKMGANPYSGYEFDCTCTESDTYAYTYPDQWGLVYLCGAFWQAPMTGTDSKAGTIVHESSHFTNIASTDDYAYGQSACKSLASSRPAQAVENADSHEYFAENNPAQS